MGKPLFTNLDFNGNSALNLIIGSLASDPASVSEGYVYYNNVQKALRLYSDGTWNSIADKFLVVDNLPNTGKSNIVYLVLKEENQNNYNTYSAYIWANNAFCQISGYAVPSAVTWDSIEGKPDILDCSILNNPNTNDKTLLFFYN